MAVKLSSRQLAQLTFLETLPPKFGRIHSVIEEMAGLRADDVVVRGLGRVLDQIKAEPGALSLTGLAETAGIMSTMSRRSRGLQMKVRGGSRPRRPSLARRVRRRASGRAPCRRG